MQRWAQREQLMQEGGLLTGSLALWGGRWVEGGEGGELPWWGRRGTAPPSAAQVQASPAQPQLDLQSQRSRPGAKHNTAQRSTAQRAQRTAAWPT